RPSTPPGQAKQPPATGAPKANTTPKTTTPLAVNPSLGKSLTPLLPPNTDLNAAAAGFRNLGQFVAAVHVSHNLGVPFASLKTEMVDHHMSLGEAIHVLKPTADPKVEANRGEAEAKVDLDRKTK